MKKYLLTLTLVIIPVLFSGTIGPWSHFKAITSDYTVNAGDTLILNAGADIRFSPGVKLYIYGAVQTNGTLSEPVRFSALSPFDPTWGGIEIFKIAPERSEFNYTIFTKIKNTTGNGAINIDESNVSFNFCNFEMNHSDFNGGAVYIKAGTVDFNGCQFKENSAGAGGGALYIYNWPELGIPGSITINKCRFFSNTAINGAGLYIDDYDGAASDMNLSLTYCGFYENISSGYGGGVFLNCLSHLNLTFRYCKIQFNHADKGGGVYARFNEMYPQNILPQIFTNLLVTQNQANTGAGLYMNLGMTPNPNDITFTLSTIAYNKITGTLPGGGGIYLASMNGVYPVIRNSILWGNKGGTSPTDDQFLIAVNPYPMLDDVFHFCNIQGDYQTGPDGLSTNPYFVRDPGVIDLTTIINPDRYDYHLSILSPSIDAGDPAAPCLEPNSSRINQGAFGNTIEARIPISGANIIPGNTASDISVQDYGVTVLDFSGKAKADPIDSLKLGTGSELHLRGLTQSLEIGTLITTGGTKFDEQRVLIQPAVDAGTNLSVVSLNITEKLELNGADISDLKLTVTSSPINKTAPVVILNDTRIYSSLTLGTDFGIIVSDASSLSIENCSIDNYNCGIEANNIISKASGRIANNSVSFDADVASKTGQQVGVNINNSNIDVEENDIENGDIGIQMKNSSGRIANNTVSFDADVATKLLDGKIAINILPGSDVIITENNLWIQDSTSLKVSGINIDSSKAETSYNKINFTESGFLTRNGIVLSNAFSGTYLYNNTVYNPRDGISNTPSSSIVSVINNIFWNEGSQEAGISDKTNLVFYNNDIEDIPLGITGSGNISSDPLCIDPENNDLVISTSSPCINEGYIVSGFHIADSTYFGSAPEIGAIEFFEVTLAAPGNITTGISSGNFVINWNVVSGAASYKIYSSSTPYGTFSLEATVYTTTWQTAVSSVKKFYYVVADSESKSLFDSHEQITQKCFKEIEKDPDTVITKKKIRLKNRSSD